MHLSINQRVRETDWKLKLHFQASETWQFGSSHAMGCALVAFLAEFFIRSKIINYLVRNNAYMVLILCRVICDLLKQIQAVTISHGHSTYVKDASQFRTQASLQVCNTNMSCYNCWHLQVDEKGSTGNDKCR